ncbi:MULTISPECIES: ATP synthase subunit C [unclassified Sedimentibacter]|uniref:ATP synthase subunit C n=1 Tax=unclassified Sedimentibacter TaxID=2649220 RepID=UPI0027E10E6B|nr:ATP synthase subunit C [Sedimentibacter sp. MB35-C1]WMJ76319.1 ATP synthase subunit C [Sedimentibacter sp. MB35-C1]
MQMISILLAAVISVGTIGYGYKTMKSGKKGNIKKAILTTVSAFSLVMIGAVIATITGGNVFAETVNEVAQATGISMGEGFKYLAAALSTGLATIGTGVAVGSVGSSAVGAVSEDSSILGKTLIFVGMAEGIAIYGMIISILILFV